MKILLIEDNGFVRGLLSKTFDDVTAFAEGKTALQNLKVIEPDVILCDLYLQDTDGLNLLEAVRTISNVPFILFTASPNRHFITAAIENGASAFLLKQDGFVEELSYVLNTLQNIKTCFLGNNVSSLLKDNYLTKRENEIARMVSEGNTSKSISEKLFISIATVNNHRKAIKRKLNYSNLAQLSTKLVSI